MVAYFLFTGWQICIWTVGVASEPVEPHPLSFSGFFIYVKWNFVANLKQIGALFWKLLSFQFYTAIYIPCNLEFMKKRPEAVARSWWILQQICFISFKSYISKQFFFDKEFFFWINPWPHNDLLKSFRYIFVTLYVFQSLAKRPENSEFTKNEKWLKRAFRPLW